MIVMKFGGASVNNAGSVKNAVEIIKNYQNHSLLVVVSAMGKTTNAFEHLLNACLYDRKNITEFFEQIRIYHLQIIGDLFWPGHQVYSFMEKLFLDISTRIESRLSDNYDFEYDQLVSSGELISATILNSYMNECGIKSNVFDARKLIITDDHYREARVDWEITERNISEKLSYLSKETGQTAVTQGFIACDGKYVTTLGREGSDYTAAIFAYALNASEVIIWKDVPGLLNADPKYFPEAEKLEEISYGEAIELAYYGATIIHPKTIKPLQNRNIPLRVKSFINPDEAGSNISKTEHSVDTIPSYIFKKEQVLLSISPKDFSFIAEDNLHHIFGVFSRLHIKLNLMQNSAISFSVCFDKDRNKLSLLLDALKDVYQLKYNDNLDLITIRHYNQKTIDKVVNNRQILLEQRSRVTIQLVVK